MLLTTHSAVTCQDLPPTMHEVWEQSGIGNCRETARNKMEQHAAQHTEHTHTECPGTPPHVPGESLSRSSKHSMAGAEFIEAGLQHLQVADHGSDSDSGGSACSSSDSSDSSRQHPADTISSRSSSSSSSHHIQGSLQHLSDATATAAASSEGGASSSEAAATAATAAAAARRTSRAEEPLLQDNLNHYTLSLSTIRHAEVWTMYKQALASFWTVDEVDLSNDLRDWRKLTDNEQHFIKYVLAFFAGSDGIVLENLAVRFMQDIQLAEVRAFYGFQIAMENIHSEMYSLLLETYVSDKTERLKLLDAINSVPIIGKKAAWAIKWISSTSSFAQRLLAFACVEGIHFSGSFCAIFWLKKRGLMPGLTFSNELISRDEGLHTDFACLLYSYLQNKLAEAEVHQLVGEAVELEREFICEALQCEVVGMNAGLMAEYIRYVADRLLVSLGYSKLYNAQNPFDWMEMISLQGKSNFFERRVGEYQKAGVMNGLSGKPTFEQFVFTTDADF